MPSNNRSNIGKQMDLAVVGRCGRVFDHLVASGQDIRPAMYNLYMKVGRRFRATADNFLKF